MEAIVARFRQSTCYSELDPNLGDILVSQRNTDLKQNLTTVHINVVARVVRCGSKNEAEINS
jgi:hypothetical protein